MLQCLCGVSDRLTAVLDGCTGTELRGTVLLLPRVGEGEEAPCSPQGTGSMKR